MTRRVCNGEHWLHHPAWGPGTHRPICQEKSVGWLTYHAADGCSCTLRSLTVWSQSVLIGGRPSVISGTEHETVDRLHVDTSNGRLPASELS